MEESLIKKGEEIYNIVEQLFGFDKESDLIKKYKFYCKYLLSLNKDNVNSTVGENYYEECEDYLKELESWLNSSNLDMRNMRLNGK